MKATTTARALAASVLGLLACASETDDPMNGTTGSADDDGGPGDDPASAGDDDRATVADDGDDDGGSADAETGDPPPGSCGLDASKIRITDVDVGETVQNNEDERALEPIAISAIPTGGARLAWKAGAQVHVVDLDADDHVSGNTIGIDANSFADLHADDLGGVVLVSRNAAGAGDQSCGTLTNLCGPSDQLPDEWACWDMYLVGFDARGETWAAKLTDSSAEHPPYLNGPTDADNVVFIWEAYAHHGRIASDGARWAAYFGAAISVSQPCVDPNSAQDTAVNIHQGDRMQLVDAGGQLIDGGFGWGCSHSGYERVIWDPQARDFIALCKTDNENRIARPAPYRTVAPIDLWYANMSSLVPALGGGYWVATSDIQPGQAPAASGLADVHLLHFGRAEADEDLVVATEPGLNARAPHLAAYGSDRLIVAWETSSEPGDLSRNDPARTLHMQVRRRDTGEAEGESITVDALGNRYHELRAFPDGSVAFTAPGNADSSVKIVRVLPCGAGG